MNKIKIDTHLFVKQIKPGRFRQKQNEKMGLKSITSVNYQRISKDLQMQI